MSDRGRDVSCALTEVRTVLSRAETAMNTTRTSNDPDRAEMHEALLYVSDMLDQWRKTGPPKKRECRDCGQKITVATQATGTLEVHYIRGQPMHGKCPGERG